MARKNGFGVTELNPFDANVVDYTQSERVTSSAMFQLVALLMLLQTLNCQIYRLMTSIVGRNVMKKFGNTQQPQSEEL